MCVCLCRLIGWGQIRRGVTVTPLTVTHWYTKLWHFVRHLEFYLAFLLHFTSLVHFYADQSRFYPSVFWCWWLGIRKGIHTATSPVPTLPTSSLVRTTAKTGVTREKLANEINIKHGVYLFCLNINDTQSVNMLWDCWLGNRKAFGL